MTAIDGAAQPGGWVAEVFGASPSATAEAEADIEKSLPRIPLINGVMKLNCSLVVTVTV
jgi:hypothetical protein